MKKIVTISIALIISINSYSQIDQQLIPDYELIGKTKSELRLMRNEIFARYGYIFKSEDLSNYFANKHWYKPRLENVEHLLTETDKQNIESIRKAENGMSLDKNYQEVLIDSELSKIQKLKDLEDGLIITKTKEINYIEHYKKGLIKIIKEKTYLGGEGEPTVIFAETIDENKPYWSTKKYFNDISLLIDYFYTKKIGCCGAEDYFEFYNYNSDNPFLKSNEYYYLIEIPNSKISLFIGYNHEIHNKEKLIIGEIVLSTIDGMRNSILFKAQNEKDYKEIIPYFSPRIELVSQNPKNKIIDNKLILWSCNNVENINNINDFKIVITFIGDETGRKKKYEIPIENGYLEGKEDLITTFIELE